MATFGKAVATFVALAALAVWSISCSTPPARQDVIESVRSCFGRPPRDWTAALNARAIMLPDGVRFGLGALSGNSAFGQFNAASGNGIGELDLTTGKLTPISSYGADASGLGGMAVDLPWLVWEQLDSQTNPLNWSVHAWNRASGVNMVLATSRLSNGGYVSGQQPLPVISHGAAAWAQPVPDASGQVSAQIRVVDLSTDHASTVDSGQVSSPVYAGPNLIWGKYSNGVYSFQAVDAHTLKPAVVPDHLRHPGSIGYLGGSPEYLVWSNQDYTSLTSWQIGSHHYREFASPDDHHHFQFLQNSGHFVLWFGGAASSVLDLTTGKAFDLQGTVATSPDRIAVAESVSESSFKGEFIASRVSSMATSEAPGIKQCLAGGP